MRFCFWKLTPIGYLVSLFILGVFLLSPSLRAQTQQGDIVGTVRDAQGAVIPGASVKIINNATGAVRNLTTDAHGDYVGLGFFPGSYRVVVEKSGFVQTEVPAIQVQPQTRKRVDVGLQVGKVVTKVTVSGAAPVVSTEGATINSNLPKVMFDKPMDNVSRSGWGFDPAVWMPGSSGGPNGLFLWGGVPADQEEIQVEGSQQSIVLFTAPESVSEISIVSGTPPAEYARSVTANMTFKSGTNALHGSYYQSLYNPAVNAVNNVSGVQPRHVGVSTWRYEFNIGGPVYIPKIYDGRNKTFFFFDYWRTPYNNIVPQLVSIPSPRILKGDFSKYTDANGNLIPIIDPLTGQQFPGNIIPPDRLSATAQAWINDTYINNYGLPFHYIPGREDTNLNNATGVEQNAGAYWNWVVKFDQNVGTKHVFTFSWNRHNRNVWQSDLCAGCYTGARELRYGTTGGDHLPQNRWDLGYTYTPTGRLVNQLRLAVARAGQVPFTAYGPGNLTPVTGQFWLNRWDIQGVPAAGIGGIPVFNIPTWGYTANPGGGFSYDTRYQGYDNLTYIFGRHTIKGGGSYIKYMQDNTFNPGFGTFTFDGRFTSEPFADLLLGLPGTFNRQQGRPDTAERIHEFAWYLQDEWRATSKLTLSYGIRWDHYNAPHDKNRLFFNFDPKAGAIVVPSQFALDHISPLWPVGTLPVVLASSVGYPAELINPTSRWLPRFSFAYRPTGSGKLVVRGGFGVYNAVYRFGGLQTGGPFSLSEAYDNSLSTMHAFPNPYGAAAGVASGVATGASVSRNFRPDYLMSWNTSVEDEFLPGWGLRVTYMGNKDTQLANQFNMNTPVLSTQPFSQSRRPFPGFQNINRIENGADANYNALQIVLHHPTSHGLMLDVSYMLQRAYTDNGAAGGLPRDTAPSGTLDYAWNRARDYARNIQWPTHDFLVNYYYELPIGTHQRFLANTSGSPAKWLLARIVGNWSATGYFNWHSGNFFTPQYTGYDSGNINQFSGRPDIVPGCNPYTGLPLSSQNPYFNASCFKAPAPGTLGNAPINMLTGPSEWVLSLSPFKEFHIPHWEQGQLRVGAQIYNLFNNGAYWGFASGIYGSYHQQPDGAVTLSPNASGTYLTPWYIRRGTENAFQRTITFMADLQF